MYQGGCLCGAARFEIHGAISNIVYCHCSQCRRAQGSAFAANGVVAVADFRLTRGEEVLTGYAVSADQTKYFCRRCGSPIYSRRKSVAGQVRVRLGAIESDITERPGAHIFVGSKANWEDIADSLPRYHEFEPGRQRRHVD